MIIERKMKRLLAIFLCLFFSGAMYAQPQNKIYIQAFNYIKNQNTGTKILTIDTLTHIKPTDFFEEIGKHWGQNEKLTLFFLDSIERSLTKDDNKAFLKNLFVKGKQPTKYIYFSNLVKIKQKMLEAEVFDSPNGAPTFGQSEKYLFIFGDKDRLQKVFKRIVSYN